MKRHVSFQVNGQPVGIDVEPRMSLADALRDELGLTGTHLGCEHGVCGACTVMLEGEAVRSCLMLAVQAEGISLATIEGLSPPQGLNPIQDAMHRHHALQCGFCTPGMVIALQALFDKEPRPDEAQIREAISGNLCRCTGYQPIVDAALELAGRDRAHRGQSFTRASVKNGDTYASSRKSP